MITEPGIYDIPMSDYLADPCQEPSISAGVAHLLLERSPLHAWSAHPRLGAPAQDYRRDAAIGTVFHAMFLGKGGDYDVHDVPDWRGKRGELRDQSIAEGKTPIRTADLDTVNAMVEAAARQLDKHETGNPTNRPGRAEQTLLWQEDNGVWCRARPDWMPADLAAEPWIINLKTSTCAHPDVWARLVFNSGYDLSAAHYIRGVEMTLGVEVVERFVVVESKPPYALSVVDLSRATLSMAEERHEKAVALWAKCLGDNRWPGYPSRVCTIDMPPHLEARQVERALSGRYEPEMLDQLIEGFAP